MGDIDRGPSYIPRRAEAPEGGVTTTKRMRCEHFAGASLRELNKTIRECRKVDFEHSLRHQKVPTQPYSLSNRNVWAESERV
jgi:hypothetical protein